MIYKFTAYGHPNILAAHKATFEFTKDKDISLNGDCIIGVNSDFDIVMINEIMKKSKNKKILITIETPDKKIKEKVSAILNPGYSDNKEFVVRKTRFISARTFAIGADKAACDISRALAEFLNEYENKIVVSVDFLE